MSVAELYDSLTAASQNRVQGWVTRSPVDDYWYAPRQLSTTAGANINEETAMAITTVFACVAKLAKTCATLPVDVVEKVSARERRQTEHPLEDLLSGTASPNVTGLSVREALVANLELWGNAYVLIHWDGLQRYPVGLEVLPSKEVTVQQDAATRELYYVWSPAGRQQRVISADYIWHLRGLSFDGLAGVSTVGYNRETLGLASAATQFGSAFFGNGAWAGGFVQRDLDAPPLSEEAAKRLLNSLNEQFRGADKAFGFGLLREGMSFKQIEMPLEDAMFLNTRQFQRVEICGMFDVPLIMIQDDAHSTFRNSEQADIAFAKHSILPRLVRIEHSARERFFRGTRLYLRHNLAGLVRGDFVSQMEGFAIGRQWGIFSINDCLEMLDRNPVEGGDERLTPLNMWPVGQPRPERTASMIEAIADAEQLREGPAALATLRPAIRRALERIVARQHKAAERLVSKHAANDAGLLVAHESWAQRFWPGQRAYVRSEISPILRGWEAATGTEHAWTANDYAEQLCGEYAAQLLRTIRETPGATPELLEYWAAGLVGHLCQKLEAKLTGEIKSNG